MPKVNNMEKKRAAHSWEIGNFVTTWGYTMNASPAPNVQCKENLLKIIQDMIGAVENGHE